MNTKTKKNLYHTHSRSMFIFNNNKKQKKKITMAMHGGNISCTELVRNGILFALAILSDYSSLSHSFDFESRVRLIYVCLNALIDIYRLLLVLFFVWEIFQINKRIKMASAQQPFPFHLHPFLWININGTKYGSDVVFYITFNACN